MRWLVAVFLFLAGTTAAEARVVTERDARDGTRAELTYDRSGDEFNRTYRTGDRSARS
jgi:hypothetical protein